MPTSGAGFDPVALMMQAGGFGIAVYLVYFVTTTSSVSANKLIDVVNKNTEVLMQLKSVIERDLERRSERRDDERGK